MGNNIPDRFYCQNIINFEISPCFIIDSLFFKKIETSPALTPYYSYELFGRRKLYESVLEKSRKYTKKDVWPQLIRLRYSGVFI